MYRDFYSDLSSFLCTKNSNAVIYYMCLNNGFRRHYKNFVIYMAVMCSNSATHPQEADCCWIKGLGFQV